MYKELKVITESLGEESSGRSDSNLAKAVHPSLCPMLILLSRLKPSTLASESGDELDPFLFMPFIRRCSTQSNLKVRVLASRALTGLVSNEKLQAVLLNIASELPYINRQNNASDLPQEQTDGNPPVSFNLIHGILLQLGSLLDTNCRNLGDFSKKDHILDSLTEVLQRCIWIASPVRCPCPILNTGFLRVVDHMLSIARMHMSKSFYVLRNLLLELSTKCLDVSPSYGLSYYDPTIAELREQAAISYFSCVFQASKDAEENNLKMLQRSSPLDPKLPLIAEMNTFDGLQARLVRSLSDSSYEVRLATLKWLFKFLKTAESGSQFVDLSCSEITTIQNWTKTNLQATLMDHLESEKHHKCTYYILRILFTWNLLHFRKISHERSSETIYVGQMDYNSVFHFWDRLKSLYELTRHMKTREMLICCMAVCIRHFADLLTSSVLANTEKKDDFAETRAAELYECLSAFVDIVKQHSSSSEPVNMRKAATESIIASGLLDQADLIGSYVLNCRIPMENSSLQFEPQEAVNMYARLVLDTWFACIKLLEDEDDGVRQTLAKDVQKCFCSKKFGSSSLAGEVQTQVEKVIELSFQYLSSIFGHWIEYFDFLLHWVHNAAGHVASEGDLVRRVFDKEIDNHHEEKLLISQICCSQLEKLPVVKTWMMDLKNKDHFRNYLIDWRMRFCNQLKSYAKDQIERQEGDHWIGGIGNHKDAFLPIYANLLAIYAVSNCIFDGDIEGSMTLHSDVIELGGFISPFLKNPLINNLYLLVVRLHEEKIGVEVSVDQLDDSIWDGFHPYFLFR